MDPSTHTGDLVMALARRVRRAHVEPLSAWHVTPSQSRALRVISPADDGMRPSALADELRIAPRSATDVVDALEERGWVRRRPTPPTAAPPPLTLTGRGVSWSRRSTTYDGAPRRGCWTCLRTPSVVRSTRS